MIDRDLSHTDVDVLIYSSAILIASDDVRDDVRLDQ
jgi:hypothetical protein